MDLPPVPLCLVKSPPWHMKFGMTRWKIEPLNPNPFSPVQRARKFSAVLGTTSALNSMIIWPTGEPPAVISKKTLGQASSLCETGVMTGLLTGVMAGVMAGLKTVVMTGVIFDDFVWGDNLIFSPLCLKCRYMTIHLRCWQIYTIFDPSHPLFGKFVQFWPLPS